MTGSPRPGTGRDRAAAALVRGAGALGTRAMARMETEVAWFGDLSAEERSWVGLIVASGIRDFVAWYAAGERRGARAPDTTQAADTESRGAHRDPLSAAVAASVFGAAPQALAGVISLEQTVELVRIAIEAVERDVDVVVAEADLPAVLAAIARYAREVAFATAEVYARAAEARGAWDARLEALVIDAVLRAEGDETVLSRAGALGFPTDAEAVVVLAAAPARLPAATGRREVPGRESDLFDVVRRRVAADAGGEALCATQGDRLVLLAAAPGIDPVAVGRAVAGVVPDGPVVVGPLTGSLATAHLSAREAVAAHRAAPGWPDAPRPVLAIDLLPERALAGDELARRRLVEDVFAPLSARPSLVDSVTAYGAAGGSVEGTARALFVHPNTVRYRLRQVEDATGLRPTEARDAFTLAIALVLGRQTLPQSHPSGGPTIGSL